MINIEAYNEVYFDIQDEERIKKIKRANKKSLLIFGISLVCMDLILPFLPGKHSGKLMIDGMPYSEALLWTFGISFFLFGISWLFYSVNPNKDIVNGKKVIIKTKIKKIIRKNSKVALELTCPELKSRPIEISNAQSYLGIKVDDYIVMSYLPKSKIVLDLKKI